MAIVNSLKGLNQKQVSDEEELFGKHVAAVLRRLPNREKAMAKLQIQQVLTNIEFPPPPNDHSAVYHNYQY